MVREDFKDPALRGFKRSKPFIDTSKLRQLAGLAKGALARKLLAEADKIDKITVRLKPRELLDKKIVVAGSSQGIGFAVGFGMLKAGAQVIFNSLEDQLPQTQLNDLINAGFVPDKDFFFISADLSDEIGCKKLITEAQSKLGKLDTLVNNVGTYKPQNFLESTGSEFKKLLDINLVSHANLSKEFALSVGKSDGGASIIFMTSLNAVQSEDDHAFYDASKAGVAAISRALSIDLAKIGIRCNSIAPGLIRTPLTLDGLATPELKSLRRTIIKQIPQGRIGDPIDVAGVAVFLASDKSSYITGQNFGVDGGVAGQQMSYLKRANKPHRRSQFEEKV